METKPVNELVWDVSDKIFMLSELTDMASTGEKHCLSEAGLVGLSKMLLECHHSLLAVIEILREKPVEV